MNQYCTCHIAPALTYSEYKEIAEIWCSGKEYGCTNNDGFPYSDKEYIDERTGFRWNVNEDGEPYMVGNWEENMVNLKT